MARSFNGTTGRIAYVAQAAQKDISTISIHFRAYRIAPGETGYGLISMHGTSDANRKYLINNDNGDVGEGFVFQVYSSGTQGRWSIAYPTNTIWYDYLITYDAGSIATAPVWYKDGVAQSVTVRSSPTGTVVSTNDNIYIGNTSDDSLTWNGYICEYAFWNRVLTQAEATKLGNKFSPLYIPNGLVFYSRLNGLASPEGEEIGFNTGTLTSTSQVAHPEVTYPEFVMNNYQNIRVGNGMSTGERIR